MSEVHHIFVGVNDLAKLEKIGFIGACKTLQHYDAIIFVAYLLKQKYGDVVNHKKITMVQVEKLNGKVARLKEGS